MYWASLGASGHSALMKPIELTLNGVPPSKHTQFYNKTGFSLHFSYPSSHLSNHRWLVLFTQSVLWCFSWLVKWEEMQLFYWSGPEGGQVRSLNTAWLYQYMPPLQLCRNVKCWNVTGSLRQEYVLVIFHPKRKRKNKLCLKKLCLDEGL